MKLLKSILLISLILSLTSCKMKYPELDDNAIAFKTDTFIDENDDDSGYLIIEYNGRNYMAYGTLKGIIKEQNIDKCIGYIIQDENSSSIVDENNKDTRIYTLKEDKDNNFLMEYYIVTNLMNQPIFLRAMDTKDKDIIIPNYIDDLGYNYWK